MSPALREFNSRELMNRAPFGPEILRAVGQAFDEAWATIEGNFGEGPLVIEAARAKLANAILAEARVKGRADVEALKAAALRTVALSYRRPTAYRE